MLRRHALFGGATGSGKSGGLNVLMGNLTACADVVIWAIDLKRGMELGPWASCIDRLATTPAEARALLADAVAILEARAALPRRDRPARLGTIPGHARADHHRRRVRRAGRDRARGHRRRRLDRPARPGRRRDPHRRDPAADAEGHGPGRAPLADGRADLLPRPRTQRRRPRSSARACSPPAGTPTRSTRPASSSSPHPSTTHPRRARAYLLTDQAVTDTATWHATLRPASMRSPPRALEERAQSSPDRPAQAATQTTRTGPGAPRRHPGRARRRCCGPPCPSLAKTASPCPT